MFSGFFVLHLSYNSGAFPIACVAAGAVALRLMVEVSRWAARHNRARFGATRLHERPDT